MLSVAFLSISAVGLQCENRAHVLNTLPIANLHNGNHANPRISFKTGIRRVFDIPLWGLFHGCVNLGDSQILNGFKER